MVASIAAGTNAGYYLSRTAYYLDSAEPEGIWFAGRHFGVAADQAVDGALFERLHAATDAAGRSLLSNGGNRVEQVGGYDMTFSASKSICLLWGMGDAQLRNDIAALHQEAAKAGVALLNNNAAFCRRGKEGHLLEKVSLTVAGFQHGEARPSAHANGEVFADPSLHTHAVVLSLAMRADGTIGRLDGRQLFAWKMAAGARYHQVLAEGMRRLGFAIEVTGKNGMFEVAGIDPDLCSYFSARRKEIVDELAQLGLATHDAPALAAAKALTTRLDKRDGDGIDRHAFWRDKCREQGVEPEHLVAQARAHALQHEQVPPDRDTLINAALAGLTERNSAFERRDLVAAVAAALVQLPGETDLDLELARIEADGCVVPLAQDSWNHAIYSTPETIALEQQLYASARQLGAAPVTAPRPELLDARLAASVLNPEQADAARIACSPVSLTIIEGGPGVGKSTLLTPVTEAWRDAGWRVIGASSAWKIANQLRDDLDIEARALDSWTARAEHGLDFLTDKTVLLIDESGLLTGRQMHRLLADVERARSAGAQVAVRLIGDRRQLQPIGGPGLRIVADAIGVQRVDTIVRQRHEWMRETVTAFGRGQAAQALAAYAAHDQLHFGDGLAHTVTAMVEAWNESRQRHGAHNILMIAKSNRQVLALNTAARTLLRAQCHLPPEQGQSFAAATPSGQSHQLDLVKGDAVRFLKRNDQLGVINGTAGTIEAITRTGHERFDIVVHVGSRKLRFEHTDLCDAQGRLMLAHAYATSCYGAQGLTTEHAFVLADTSMDRHDIFVAASRAREATHLFVDRNGLDQRIQAARPLTDRQRAPDQTERLGALAAAFSTAKERVSTLDYLDAAERLALDRQQSREHQRHHEQVL